MTKVLLFASHPIQYQAPLFRLLAKEVDLIVVYGYQALAKNQADAGFGVEFKWDVPLLDGYTYEFAELENDNPNTKQRKGLVLKDPKEIIKKHQPEVMIVNGWFPQAMLQMIKAGAKLNIPVYVRGDSNLQMRESKLKTFLKKWYFKWLFNKITFFLYVGALNKNLYLEHGVDKKQLIFAPHSIDNERFTQAFKQHPKPKNKKFVIGFVGKFIAKKNPLELIKAVVQLETDKQIRIKWIGDGPLKAEIEKTCKAHNIDFEITGFLNQSELVKKGFANLDLMVLPSAFNETWGLVVNEVYCGSIPVITSDKVGCAPDLVKAVHTNLVYPAGKADQLAKSISFAIKNYSSIQEKIKGVSAKYSIQNTLKGYLKAIQQNNS